MASKRTETRVDPELTRQLEAAGADEDRPIQAVVYLRCDRPSDPDSVTEAARRVIDSASTKAGSKPARVNVMRYIGTVAVEAPASFVRALIAEDDVTSALANVHPDDDPGLGKVSAGGDRMMGGEDQSPAAEERGMADHDEEVAHAERPAPDDGDAAGGPKDSDRTVDHDAPPTKRPPRRG